MVRDVDARRARRFCRPVAFGRLNAKLFVKLGRQFERHFFRTDDDQIELAELLFLASFEIAA